ncbi:hypothetical protein Poly59_02720 [Rubripirellula reticaptiva]|uniref:Uncharacterized protein n=2 Tax=Rubripirellula reticaptiva TaxID=2528013 RepID=A0A5C6F7X7_9BACT|nr:hypothetical protein Poly59_02720 [Rubripirellula reticaptiva]
MIGCVIIILMLVWLLRDHLELSELKSDIVRLESSVGVLDVVDPSRLHIKFSEVDAASPDDVKLIWRLWIPGGENWRLTHGIGGSRSGYSGFSSSDGRPQLLSVRMIREDSDCVIHVVTVGSTFPMNGGKNMASFVTAHWDSLVLEIAGKESQLDMSSDQITDVLRIGAPKSLRDEFQKAFPNRRSDDDAALTVFQLRLGTEQSFVNEEAELAEAKAGNQ